MTVDFSARANWGVISPAEMGWTGKYDPRKHPDMLATITFTSRSGVTFSMRTHKLWAPILLEALRILDPHIQGGFDSQPDKGSYNPDSTLQDGSPSMHAVGNAGDLEWLQNPMYATPRPTGPHTLPADTAQLLRHLGIGWGGLWDDLHDWMHIENHLTPADTIALGAEIEKANQQKGFTMQKSDEAVIRQIVREEVRSVLRADVDDNGKTDKQPYSITTIVHDALGDYVPAIAKATAKELAATLKTVKP